MPRSLAQLVAAQLRRAKRRAGVDVEKEALLLVTTTVGLSEAVLDGQNGPADAFAVIDYALDRALIRSSAGP